MNLQKLRLGQLKPAATTEAGDTHFSKVTAMFNFDGSHGDTTTSGLDASNKNLTLSYSSGDQLSNTQKKFGATSLYVADTVILSSSDGFDMGTGDFTMEAWFYFTSFANSFALFDQWDTSGSTRHQVWHSAANGGRLSWYYAGTSGFHSANPAVSTGAWTHIAFVRYSGTLKMYINGTAESNTASHSGQFGRSHTMYFGHQHGGGGGAGLFYMDDLRITKGLARYTSNFTAPTSTHLTVEGDSLKQVIVNEDADSIIVGTGGINTTRIAKAWVNFNGSGTVAIRDSYNVSSITDNATGRWRVNFSTNLDNANFSVSAALGTVTGSSLATSALIHCGNDVEYAPSTSGFTLSAVLPSVSWQDPKYLSAQVFGN
jgi:hypothetical protein